MSQIRIRRGIEGCDYVKWVIAILLETLSLVVKVVIAWVLYRGYLSCEYVYSERTNWPAAWFDPCTRSRRYGSLFLGRKYVKGNSFRMR
jgi:hypothetical protein